MKMKTVLISAAIIVAAAALVYWWRSSHIVPRKYVIAQKKTVSVPAARREGPAVPAPAKKVKAAKVAIVIDDFGYNMNNLEALFNIRQPVTLSVLPNLRYSGQIAKSARVRGYEVILHLPLAARRKEVKEEIHTIKSGMAETEIIARLEEEIASVPGISGVSNHMGSEATEDSVLMSIILKRLKKKGLYFFDSLTSEKSVCREVSRSIGIRYARRDIFLDNAGDIDSIERQLQGLRRFAIRRGRAIAICHDRAHTVAALASEMPRMAKDGIVFVSLSEMVQ